MDRSFMTRRGAISLLMYDAYSNEINKELVSIIERSDIDSLWIYPDQMGTYTIELYNLYTNRVLSLYPIGSDSVGIYEFENDDIENGDPKSVYNVYTQAETIEVLISQFMKDRGDL